MRGVTSFIRFPNEEIVMERFRKDEGHDEDQYLAVFAIAKEKKEVQGVGSNRDQERSDNHHAVEEIEDADIFPVSIHDDRIGCLAQQHE